MGDWRPSRPARRVVHPDPGEPLRTVLADELGVAVDPRARDRPATGNPERRDPAPRVAGRPREHLELAVAHQIRDLDQLEPDAKVGPVGPEALHRLAPGEAGQRVGQLDASRPREEVAHHSLDEVEEPVHLQKGGFDVDLGELGLPVGPQVLVPEAANDLVVALHPRHHEELLEELGGLREGEEAPLLGAARHEVVAGALGGRLGQHRGLDVEEAVRIEVGPDNAGHLAPKPQVLVHAGPAKIDVPVPEPGLLVDRLVVELERRGARLVQHLDGPGEHLDPAGRELGVLGALGAVAHPPFHPEHVLAARAVGERERLRGVRVDDDLEQPGAVPEIDEDDPAVVAPPVQPAAHRDRLAVEPLGHLPAEMCSHVEFP